MQLDGKIFVHETRERNERDTFFFVLSVSFVDALLTFYTVF